MSHSVKHGDFTVSRTIKAPVDRVYQAFADQTAKEKWFKGPTDQAPNEHTMDFRVGGSEVNRGSFHDGMVHTFRATYYDIVPDERIVYAYEMYLNDERISVSLATIELMSESDQTTITLHESGAFLDSLDKPEVRQQGTESLMDALVASVTD